MADISQELATSFQASEGRQLVAMRAAHEVVSAAGMSPEIAARVKGQLDFDELQLAADPGGYFARKARVNAVAIKYGLNLYKEGE